MAGRRVVLPRKFAGTTNRTMRAPGAQSGRANPQPARGRIRTVVPGSARTSGGVRMERTPYGQSITRKTRERRRVAMVTRRNR